jgi:hypothetical protein
MIQVRRVGRNIGPEREAKADGPEASKVLQRHISALTIYDEKIQ